MWHILYDGKLYQVFPLFIFLFLYSSCSLFQDCEANTPDFRSVQCSRFDNQPYHGMHYTWEPFNGQSILPCELSCITTSGDHLRVVPEVDDGTRCFSERLRPEVRDICIKGKCHVSIGLSDFCLFILFLICLKVHSYSASFVLQHSKCCLFTNYWVAVLQWSSFILIAHAVLCAELW